MTTVIALPQGKHVTGDIDHTPLILSRLDHYLRKRGRQPTTIEGKLQTIKSLINNQVDLDNPESVLEYLISLDVTNGRKRNIANAYHDYVKLNGLYWEKPIYERVRTTKEFLPTELLLLQIIAGLPGKHSPFCLMLMETGARSIELWNLKWAHLDFGEKVVHIPPAKHSDGRTIGISQRMITLLKNLPHEPEYVFRKGQLKHFREGYRRHRKKLSHKFADPEVLKCSFKTYRDFVGTWVFEETGSKSEVAMWLGHRRESSTQPYIVRKKLAPKHYHTRVAHSTEEEIALSNLGYEYIKDTRNGDSLWRKRKR